MGVSKTEKFNPKEEKRRRQEERSRRIQEEKEQRENWSRSLRGDLHDSQSTAFVAQKTTEVRKREFGRDRAHRLKEAQRERQEEAAKSRKELEQTRESWIQSLRPSLSAGETGFVVDIPSRSGVRRVK